MSDSKKIRVPATTVQLVQILGEILREHIKISLYGTECWTFEHVADWEIKRTEYMLPSQENDGGSFDPQDYEYKATEYRMTTYLGSGKCLAFGYGDGLGSVKELQLRVRCELCNWVPTGLKFWDVQAWIKLPDGSITCHHYQCHLGYGQECDIISAKDFPQMPEDPPRKIAFWQQTDGMREKASRVVQEVLCGTRQVEITFKRDMPKKSDAHYLLVLFYSKLISMPTRDRDQLSTISTVGRRTKYFSRAIRITLNKKIEDSRWEEMLVNRLHHAIERIEVMK